MLDFICIDTVLQFGNGLIFASQFFVVFIQMSSHVRKKFQFGHTSFIINFFNISAFLLFEKFNLLQQIKKSIPITPPTSHAVILHDVITSNLFLLLLHPTFQANFLFFTSIIDDSRILRPLVPQRSFLPIFR
jgi:hypothetical protein